MYLWLKLLKHWFFNCLDGIILLTVSRDYCYESPWFRTQLKAHQLEKNVAERELREAEHRQWLSRHDEELSAQRQELGNLARGAAELRSGLQEARFIVSILLHL